MLKIKEIKGEAIPIELLLEADPSEKAIQKYLQNSLCFGAFECDQIVGSCVTKEIAPNTAEIFNIAVAPSHQQRGIGSKLLKSVLTQLAERDFNSVVLGTGAFGYQLTFYQRLGFRVDSVVKDFFLDNYPEPIFEDGIQHKDMLRLTLDLTNLNSELSNPCHRTGFEILS